jgi:hypothetical protein
MTQNSYRLLGFGLAIGGAIFAPVAYFILESGPITAVALSAIMIGFTSIALSVSRPQISPEASQLILETGMENVASLIEELGLENRAIYLPSSLRSGHAQALIPLGNNFEVGRLKGKIPKRLIVRYGDAPSDIAIAVTAPGSTSFSILDIKPGQTSEEIETAINYVLTGLLDLAGSASVVMENDELKVEVSGPGLHYENVWYYRCMGSPVASIVATLSAEGLGKPVRIKKESYNNKKSSILLEVLQ